MMRILPSPAKSSHELNERLIMAMKHFVPHRFLRVEVHLAEHCNLNCKGCDHFSPLADKEFPAFETLDRDFARLSLLYGGECESINLLGGEPLLNPELPEILAMVRNYFPKGTINLVTNGLLLQSMKDDFWTAMRDQHIVLQVTKYPVNVDYKKCREIAEKWKIDFEFFNNSGKETKSLWKIPLDLSGKMDYIENILNCSRAGHCVFLEHGKIYPCPGIPMIRHFNKFFHTDIPVSKLDYIDIYEAKSAMDIANFLTMAVPFCRFCNIRHVQSGIKYAQSQRKIEEWIDR